MSAAQIVALDDLLRIYITNTLMINKLLLLLFLALLLNTTRQGLSSIPTQPDLDQDTYSDDQQDEEESSEYSQPMGYSVGIDQEVNIRIGIHDEEVDEEGHAKHPADLSNLHKVLDNNRKWAREKIREDTEYFAKHVSSQKPKYLWVGCSDSRLPANEILGLEYGEVFVLRNVANMVSPSDISSLAVIQYAVEVLQVSDIIVAGHYNCGGVKAAVTKYNHGPLEAWLSKLRRIRHKHAHAFQNLTTVEEKAKLLVEINVKEQVFNVASTPFVQQAWKNGQELRIHGLVFSLTNGKLIDLNITLHTLEQLPEELAVVQ